MLYNAKMITLFDMTKFWGNKKNMIHLRGCLNFPQENNYICKSGVKEVIIRYAH